MIQLLKLMSGVDRQKVGALVVGITGIYCVYFVLGVLQEAVLKSTYPHDDTGQHSEFDFPEANLMIPAATAYLVALLFNRFKYPPEVRNCIEWTLNLKSGAMVTISAISYSYAIKLSNFPLVMMIRSCNVLSVVMVGVLFTGVKDTALKLGNRKVVVAAIATAGMIIFKVFDPSSANADYSTQTTGLILIVVSLIADGFLPDYQAVIKSIYKPPAIVMLQFVNKWAMILSIAFSVGMGNFIPMITFLLDHQKLMIDLLLIGLLSTAGQFFVYYLAMRFRQHIVPLIVGTRKIFTVGLSIIYYKHSISPMQLFGLVVVFCISVYEFSSESQTTLVQKVKKSKQKEVKDGKQQ